METDMDASEFPDEQYEDSSASDESDPVKGSHLPVARIKKIMKEGEHQGMISSDAPVILAKACEMLIRDLTLQSWDCTQMTKRCTIQRQDITCAIFKNDTYNFLYDLLPPEDLKPILENQQVPMGNNGSSDHIVSPQLTFSKTPQNLCYKKESNIYQQNPRPHPYKDYRSSPLNSSANIVVENVSDNDMIREDFMENVLIEECDSNCMESLSVSTVQSFSC